ncbi:Hypothetical protein FKW44_017282, partial [Caligus rogercresseyi]
FIFNNTFHVPMDCPLLKTIKHFTHLSVCGNSNVIRATILFGTFKRRRRRKISPHQKAAEFDLLNMKSFIAKRLLIQPPQ